MKAFCDKVKEKISSDKYLAFLKCFHRYCIGRIKMDDLKKLVNDLLGEYPGFFDEFLYVLKSSDDLTGSMESKESRIKGKKPGSEEVGEINECTQKIKLSSSFSQKPTPESTIGDINKDHLLQALGFCEKVRKKSSSGDYLTFLKCLHYYGTGKITMVDVKIMIADYVPDFMDDLDHVLEFTPSYQFLPKKLSGVHSEAVTTLGKEVMNSCCFSKGSYGVHLVRPRDPHEKMLNVKEDELFERDMLMAWMSSTKMSATKLSEAIKVGKIKKPTFKDVNKYFTSYNFRFIEKMYGNSGLLVVDQLRHSPETVLPVLINRLNKMESLG